MKFTATAIALLLGLTSAHAQSVSAGRLGVTPTAEPEPVYVLDKHNVWNTIGSMTGGNFTPVAGGGGGGGGGDTNIAQWGAVNVGAMTNYGTAPSGLFPGVNAYVTNVVHVIVDSGGGGGGTFVWPGTATPTNYGTAPAGTVPAVNAFVTNPSTLAWPGSATPSNYGTAPTGSVPAVNAFVTNPSTFSWPGGAPVTNYGTPPTGLVPAVNAAVQFPSTQAVSAAALPLPAGAATATLQSTVESPAGTAASNAVMMQGCPTCLPAPVSPGIGSAWNVTQGTTPWVTSSTLVWPGTAGLSAYGTAPSGTVPAVNAFVTNPGSGVTTQGNAGSNAQAWWARLGDGTNGAVAVKPASTTPTATDPALVVSISPNSASVAGNVFQATNFSSGTISTGATTQVFPISGTTTIYLVNYSYQTDAAATGNGSFQIITGTGTNCATIHQTLTPVWNFAQNAGIAEGNIGLLGASNPGDAMCVVTSASQKVNWRIGVAIQ